jgi:hypothetical protein
MGNLSTSILNVRAKNITVILFTDLQVRYGHFVSFLLPQSFQTLIQITKSKNTEINRIANNSKLQTGN